MELSSEDELRLQVLLVNAEAVRIDEQRMVVCGWSAEREFEVQLTPVGSADRYVQTVRAYLSTAVLGSPKHFPVHLRRWAGHGQIDSAPLEKLLLLGNPEAIFAVACSPRLTATLAQRVWWSAPGPDMARQLLRHRAVATDFFGKTLAQWLVEYLPFETELSDMLDSARLLLQPNLIDASTRMRLWDMGRRNKAYRIGFLLECPNDLPQPVPARSDAPSVVDRLTPLIHSESEAARMLFRTAGVEAQSFLAASLDVLGGLNSQAEVSAALNAIGAYHAALRVYGEHVQTPQSTLNWVELELAKQAEIDVHYLDPVTQAQLRALYILAHTSDEWVTPIFAQSDAGGSVMRKQIAPVVTVVADALRFLRQPSGNDQVG